MKFAAFGLFVGLFAALPAHGLSGEIPVSQTTRIWITNTYVIPQGDTRVLLDEGRQTTQFGNVAYKHQCMLYLKNALPKDLVLPPADYKVISIEYRLDLQPVVDLSSSLFSQIVVLRLADKNLESAACFRTNDGAPVVNTFVNVRQVLAADAIFLKP